MRLPSFLAKYPKLVNRARLLSFQVHTPLLLMVGPEVVETNDSRVEIKIPLNYRTGNSWNSMFFAAIASGCDLTGTSHTSSFLLLLSSVYTIHYLPHKVK